MDTAKCTIDGQNHYAPVFASLPARELEQKRRALVCSACGYEAYFRKASARGQDACFGARPHAPGCSAAALPGGKVQLGGEEQDILNNPGEVIVLDLNYGAAPNVNPLPGHPINSGNAGGRFVGHGNRPNARSLRRLRPILRNLVYSEQFRNSRQVIELPNRPASMIRDFFVPFSQIGREHQNRFRGYWGMVSDAVDTNDGGVWLNFGSYKDFSVIVSAQVKAEFLDRNRIDSVEDLAGCHVLVLGTLSVSVAGKPYLVLDEVGFSALYDDIL